MTTHHNTAWSLLARLPRHLKSYDKTHGVKKWVFLLVILTAVTALISVVAPFGIDWAGTYRPACWLVLTGHSPYENRWFYNPPWVLIPLIPLALLPEAVGRGLLFTISVIILIYVLRRRGASSIGVVALLLSPPGIGLVYGGNIEAIVWLGFILPPPIAVFFLIIKPQVGMGLMVYWLASWLLERDFRRIVQVFGPVTIISLICIFVFPDWLDDSNHLVGNSSLWPWSIAPGLVALVYAIHHKRAGYAIPVGPALSPYLSFQSWSVALIPLASHTLEMVVANVGLWIMVAAFTFMTQ